MKFDLTSPPRKFRVGLDGNIELTECGRITLDPDELVTFVDETGAEYDVARKAWGYYATPSMNGRLRQNGYKTALVRNGSNQYFIMLVKKDCQASFADYLESEQQELVTWLDDMSGDTFT